MTAEEAIIEIKDASDSEVRYGDTKHHYSEVVKRVEAFDMAIKALEQQTCEDCISRKDTLDAIETWDKFGVNAEQKLVRWQDHYIPYVHLDDVRNAIANMPSITPTRPTAGWEKFDNDYIKCSKCERIVKFYHYNYRYCPHCGARMTESEEEA